MPAPTRASYGIEAEFFGINPDDAVDALQSYGLNAEDDGYHHETRRYWRVTEDGSVNGSGLELVSPILQRNTRTHSEQVRNAAIALRSAGAVVDTSCGLHVHHSLVGKDIEDVAQAAGLYTLFQDVIDTVLPASRKGRTASGYCRPMTAHDGPTGWVESIRRYTWRELRNDGCWNFGRYHGVNLQAMNAHGTLEFRQHSGTLNATKIANWTKFTRLFMDANERGISVESIDNDALHELQDIASVITFMGGPRTLAEFYTKRAELFAAASTPDEEDVSEGGRRFVNPQAEEEEEYDWCASCGEYH